MITVATLDPSTLSLWYDLSSNGIESREYPRAAVEAALRGDLAEVARVRSAAPPADRGLIVALASAIWHERRHFVDLALTNYGATKFRQFLSVYANIPTILQHARDAGVLACPLHVYTCDVRLDALGIPPPPEDLVRTGQDLRSRSRYSEQENTTKNGLSFGGDAQLEAIAYAIQNTAAATHLPGAWDDLVEFFPAALRASDLYTWLPGLLDHRVVTAPGGYQVGGSGAAVAFLVAALCIGPATPPGVGSAQPLERADSTIGRLLGLLRETDRGRRLVGPTIREDWAAVNAAAQRLWGRTVLDDLHEDLARGDRWVRGLEGLHGPNWLITRLARDYQQLRQRMVGLLTSDPGALLDGPRFARETLPRVVTQNVLTVPSGSQKPLPPGAQALARRVFRRGGHTFDVWWCAERPLASVPANALRLTDVDAWRSAMTFESPLARLLMTGRRGDGFGPLELEITRGLTASGIDLRIEGVYQRSMFESRSAAALHALRADPIVCDRCGGVVASGGGSEIHPRVLRAAPERTATVVEWFGGGPAAAFRAEMDWSSWVVCETCSGWFRTSGWVTEG